jgi:1-acyl-sn-glycerol-3-phosphate acyltransferase
MAERLASFLRQTQRLAPFLAVAFSGLWHHRALPANPTRAQAAEWLHRECARGLRAINVQLEAAGELPSGGMIVSNHLSYLDILAYSACQPCVFVSKADVQSWPIFGTYARWAGSVFVCRHDRNDAARANLTVTETLRSGVPVVLFPEGTTTDGRQVLRFHSTMLQPAIDAECDVTPCAIGYELEDGDASAEVSWWGDMPLLPHALNLLGKKLVRAKITFGKPVRAVGHRKQLSLLLRQQIIALHQRLAPRMDASGTDPARVASLQELGK